MFNPKLLAKLERMLERQEKYISEYQEELATASDETYRCEILANIGGCKMKVQSIKNNIRQIEEKYNIVK